MAGNLTGHELVDRFLRLETVAVVGASERQHHTRALTDSLVGQGLDEGRISYVSPTNAEVHGRKTVPALADLGFVPSLVFCLVPARHVEGVLAEAGELGSRAFVSIADGFADAGEEGRLLQDRLGEVAGRYDVALLGPNTLGYLAPGFGVGAWVGDWSAMGLPPLRTGGVSIVAQSSGILNIALQLAAHRRVGIRCAVSVGNEAVVDAASFIEALADDAATSVLGVVLESTTRPRALARALAAARRAGKRVLVLKFGSSEIGRRNALSHSGRLASPGRVWGALFDRLGTAVASDFDEFIDGLNLAAKLEANRFNGGDLGFLTVSGGDVGLVSDLCEEIGVALAPLSEQTRSQLLAVEGNVTHAASNPLDLGLIGHREEVLDGIAAGVFADPGVGIVGSRLALPWRFSERAARPYEILARHAAEHAKPLVVVTRAAEPLANEWYEFFSEHDTAVLAGYGSGIRTLRTVLELCGREGDLGRFDAASLPESVTAAGDEAICGWDESQALLSNWGVRHVAAERTDTPDGAVAAAARLGYPVCVKGLVPGVVHKSDAGLVRLGLRDGATLRDACTALAAAAGDGECTFEVQPMVAIAHELIVGLVRDPIIGPVITLGAGGTAVERLDDVVFVLPPLAEDGALAALGRLRVGREMLSDRGVSEAQRARLGAFVATFARAAAVDASIAQVDLNPVVLTLDGDVLAVDATVTSRSPGGS